MQTTARACGAAKEGSVEIVSVIKRTTGFLQRCYCSLNFQDLVSLGARWSREQWTAVSSMQEACRGVLDITGG